MDVDDQLFARADALMRNAPGTVDVRRISHIDDVRALRAARAALTETEAERLRLLRLELMERLDGAVAARPARTVAAAETGVVAKLLGLLQRGSQAMRTQGNLVPAQSHDDRPTRLPAPNELLDAAEAWVISHWVADRVAEDLGALRAPWEQSRLLPSDS